MRARNEGKIKELEAEAMDRKADGANVHGEQLRSDIGTILERIAGYPKYIDGCTKEMRDCENISAQS